MARISGSSVSTLAVQAHMSEPASVQAESRPARIAAAAPAPQGASSAQAALRERHKLQRLLQARARGETDESGSRDRTDSARSPSAASLTRACAASGQESAIGRAPPLRTTPELHQQGLETHAAAGPGHDAVIKALAALLKDGIEGNRRAAATVNAAGHRLPAPSASLADIIEAFSLVAAGLDHASLEQALTALAGSLPYEKNDGSLAALRAFGDALDQHGGRLDDGARERLLAAFDARTKPRKTGSPYLRVMARKAGPESGEFSNERRSVRARLKPPSGKLNQTGKRSLASFNAGSAAAPRQA